MYRPAEYPHTDCTICIEWRIAPKCSFLLNSGQFIRTLTEQFYLWEMYVFNHLIKRAHAPSVFANAADNMGEGNPLQADQSAVFSLCMSLSKVAPEVISPV